MREWFLINANGDVINCATTSHPEGPVLDPTCMGGVRWDPNPPMAKLEEYRYWNERP